jgi:hypothetical protein
MGTTKAIRLAWAAGWLLTIVARAGAGEDGLGSPKKPVMIPRLTEKIVVEGEAAHWAKIKPLPVPYQKKDAGMLNLGWDDDGIYGCVQVKDSKITVDADNPWNADCLELWFESDCKRQNEMSAKSFQITMAPNPAKGAGPCIIVVPQGSAAPEKITAKWKPVAGGYVIEFFIPSAQIKLAKMEEGTELGFNYAVDDMDDKGVLEQFYCDKNDDEAYKTPHLWGVIKLGK